MDLVRHRVVVTITACLVSLGAWPAMPQAGADPDVTLPPMTSTGSGPIIGGGDTALQQRISEQLVSFDKPDIEEVDGSDAAQFITAATAVPNRELATVFRLLERALGCQTNNAGFGARAYRRTDGGWGGAMLVIAKSTVTDVDALKACVKSGWRRATAGGPDAMCNSGWTYPPYTGSRGGEGYFVLLAGTAADFCSVPNANYRTKASGWPL
ncbi:hypothetical protein MB901379_00576 [Mycobacterium basiliense]|uniref:Secreted protein n=1 Tax=Mycobacterium basiliense TaxID=2094119 RepID=A0A3S4BFC8_9MYCO|nr:hypothetical protein [Mycobacterium basiliense]VDM87042.1 hypothetical protein MB901379_00576 [Mycobacterium basiliense]